jgi:hypothetical protein
MKTRTFILAGVTALLMATSAHAADVRLPKEFWGKGAQMSPQPEVVALGFGTICVIVKSLASPNYS